MFNEVQQLVQGVESGQVDQPAVSQAASEHVSTMDSSTLMQHLQSAAQNADQNGQSDTAQGIRTLVSQASSNPGNLQQQAISLITNNPQILEHFAPEFAKGILARL